MIAVGIVAAAWAAIAVPVAVVIGRAIGLRDAGPCPCCEATA